LVVARARDGHLEVRLDFDEADNQAIKEIPGRRWVSERKVWTLPHTPEVLDALTKAFGSRLMLGPQVSVGAHAEVGAKSDAGAAAEGAGAPPTSRTPPRSPPAPRLSTPSAAPGQTAEKSILEALSVAIRTREYSPKTESAYVAWARRFLDFNRGAGRADAVAATAAPLDPARGKAFLEHLATDARLGAKTRNQAASAIGFMFREVLGQSGFEDVPRAKGPRRLPTVLSHREVLRVLRELNGDHRLIASLLYSAGLRLEECLQLRVKDVDFELRQIFVREGKGKKDRYVPLAHRTLDVIRARVVRRRDLHEEDLRRGHGWATLPGALDRKDPGAGYELGWQFVFPSRTLSKDPVTGRTGRRALHASAVQREVKAAVRRSSVSKHASCHTFRHSFATEALRGGCDIRTLQHVLGHKDVRTTMIYLHVVEQTGFYVRSPLDRPPDPDDPDWEVGAGDPPRPSLTYP
jgi:integron integrase